MKFYTGIGSRKTPSSILGLMNKLGKSLEKDGFILRSGNAKGADQAFAKKVRKKVIYLPFDNFNGLKHNGKEVFSLDKSSNLNKAKKIASKYHPAWNKLSDTAKKFIIRNGFQVLGGNLDNKSNFVVCWTPDGATTDEERTKKTGGTGQAISIASQNNIPVFNLQLKAHRDRIKKYIN